ncbi:hypothetical protein INS49_015595 [Diaporthe citri]|uniref:uncharacterized protein n=1 Tax=Diaporthe citri TaxID=83186 RepID=UPI001C7F475F|nr:uncharacterized protein INS49_015595 [Diaporthe citri]KAG6356208.1 hypothetical protein INS49_015595 [Diaporthe citri]
MRHTNLLFTAVKNTYQKQESGSSGPSDMSNRYHRIGSCSSSHREAMLLDATTNGNNMPNIGLAKRIPTITLNDDEVPLVSFDSANSDPFIDPPDTADSNPFVDPPDSVPALDLSTLKSNPAALRTAMDTQAQGQPCLQAESDQHHPFRVIIVGGGPNGLALAHALHQAGIDYTLLDGSPITPIPNNNDQDGTSLVLWPHSARILDQLGLLRRVQRLSCPIRTRQTHRADGTPCPPSDDNALARSRHDHGRPCMLISRAALLNLLWEALPERAAHVRTGKEVVDVETHAAGVRVTCTDGSVEEGSVVVACDGVHGEVRQLVRYLRAEKKRQARRRLSLGPGGGSDRDGKADRVVEARYYGLVGSAPLLDGLEPGVCYETHGDATGKTFQVLAGQDTAYFLVYIPLRRPTRQRTIYPAQNAEYLASALAQHPITDKIKFGDLWRARRSGKMVDFHEGIAEKWYHERVVLVGDAAHTMTPSLGLGVNTGFQGVAELTNGLRRLLRSQLSGTEGGGGQVPDTASIKRVFKAYQNDCDSMARSAMLVSSFYNRAIAHRSHRTPRDNFYGLATPAVADVALLERQVGWAVRLGITLDFVEEKHFKEGRMKWANARRRVDTASAEEEEERRTVFVYPGIPMRVRAT